MKLNLFFMLIDLLIILSTPFMFVWSTLSRISKALVVLQTSRRHPGQHTQTSRD